MVTLLNAVATVKINDNDSRVKHVIENVIVTFRHIICTHSKWHFILDINRCPIYIMKFKYFIRLLSSSTRDVNNIHLIELLMLLLLSFIFYVVFSHIV